MFRASRVFLAVVIGLSMMSAGCNKPPPPRVDAATEQAEATKRAQQRAYGGDAMKALEAAKGLDVDLNKKALEGVEKAEK